MMRLFYLLPLLFPTLSFAFDDQEQAQMAICGVVAKQLAYSYAAENLDPDLLSETYEKLQREKGGWRDKDSEYMSLVAYQEIEKVKKQFYALNPIGARNGPIGELLDGTHDASFFAWSYFSCDRIYGRLKAGKN
jgi:hypothetical protein